MREIGVVPDKDQARRFADYLLIQDIVVQERESKQGIGLWVVNENHWERARDEFAQFQTDPRAARYAEAITRAKERRRQIEQEEREYRRLHRDVSSLLWASSPWRRMPVTLALIVVCITVWILQLFWEQRVLTALLLGFPQEDGPSFWRDLALVRRGDVWRVFTPIFLHFGILHLVFNLSCLYQFGDMIESRLGSVRFFLMVAVSAAASNVAQTYVSGPLFGGMSGVVYALFGFIWIRCYYDRNFLMTQNTVIVMVGWLVLCSTGSLDELGVRVANTAHAVGLLSGTLIALGLRPFFREDTA